MLACIALAPAPRERRRRRGDAAGSEGQGRQPRAPTTTRRHVDHRRRRRRRRSATFRSRSRSINSALMQAQGATSLADALRNVPGITMGAAEGGIDRQQLQPARLLRAHRPLSRRHARPRPVLPRRLLARRGRGAAGPVVDAVRPRLDRRRHQPGEQAADAHAVRHASRRSSARSRRSASPPTSTSRSTSTSAFRDRGDGAGRRIRRAT